MNKAQKFIILFTVVFSLVAVPLSFAWTEVSYTGSWDVRERKNWQCDLHGGLYAYADGVSIWEDTTASNFAGYHTTVNSSYIDAVRLAWWHVRSEVRIDVLFTFTGTSDTLYALLRMRNCEESWGFIDDDWMSTILDNDTSNWGGYLLGDVNPYGTTEYLDNGVYYPSGYLELWLYNDGNDNAILEVQLVTSTSNIALHTANFTVNANFWTDAVTIQERVYHNGYGYFMSGLDDTIYTGSYSPSIPEGTPITGYGFLDFISDLTGTISKAIPDFLRQYLNLFTSWASGLLGFLGVIWASVVWITPVLPLILLFYILDAVISSVLSRSIQPVGIVFTRIVEIGVTVASFIVSIANYIYDVIHFW